MFDWLTDWLNIDWKVDWLMDRRFDWLTDYKQNDDKSWANINFRIGRNKLISGDFRSSKFQSFLGEHAPGPLYIDSRLQSLLSSCYTWTSPIKKNMLWAQIQNHDSFCEQCFMCNLNQRCKKKAVGTRSKLHKKYLFHSYQYPMVLTPWFHQFERVPISLLLYSVLK